MSTLLKNLWKKVIFPPKEARGLDLRRVPECFGVYDPERIDCRHCRLREECEERIKEL